MMLTKRRRKSKKTRKGASGNGEQVASENAPKQSATLARHPLLDDFGCERLQEFRRQHAESINGLDSATISIQVPQHGFDNAPQEIHSWTIIGPRGLVEAMLTGLDAWVRVANAKIAPADLRPDFFAAAGPTQKDQDPVAVYLSRELSSLALKCAALSVKGGVA